MKKNIAVIFGGKSAEHDVSIITAHLPIINSLQAKDKYNVIPIYIAKNGNWYSSKKMNDLKFFKNKNYEQKLNSNNKLQIFVGEKFEIKESSFFAKKLQIDIVFPAMHGTYGEDGSLMGLLRMSNVAFVGCDIFASAVAMDKVLTKQILQSENIPVTKYIWFTKDEFEKSRERVLAKVDNLKYPLFIKPVHLGSSIGISKARNKEELINGIEVAIFYDNKVLVEEGVENLIEVTLPIIGNDELTFANIERPLNKADFFDFNDKYIGSGGKKGGEGVNSQYSEIPAKIEQEFTDKVLEYGERTYRSLGCSGISRVDFLIDTFSRIVYVNEVNTMPGGLYDHNFKKKGITNIDLVQRLINLAIERFGNQNKIQNIFNSTILEKVGGQKFQ